MVYLPKQNRKEEMKMIKNKSELKQKINEKLEMKASEFIDNLELSEEDFTIEAIEDIMMRFSKETNQLMIEAVNETLSLFDESKIIAKKKKKLQG